MDDLGTLDACKASDLKGSNGNALPPAGQLMEPSFAKAERVREDSEPCGQPGATSRFH